MGLDTLQAAVEAAFNRDAPGVSTWLNPHVDREPATEEYSRCLDPEKFRILTARAEAWTQALVGLDLAVAEVVDLDSGSHVWREGFPMEVPPTRAVRLRPRRPGALPLVLSFRGFDGPDDNIVTVSAGDPAVPSTTVPACGCDACDEGSESYLEDLDDHILDVVTGEFVHVSTRRLTVVAGSQGWEANAPDNDEDGAGRIKMLLEEARAGRSPHRVVHGVRW